MTNYALPQTEHFETASNNKMGPVNGAYAGDSTVDYPTGRDNHITGGRSFRSVHVGNQTRQALLQFNAGAAEVYMGFWLKASLTATGDTDDTFRIATIKFTTGSSLVELWGWLAATDACPYTRLAYRRVGDFPFFDIGGNILDGAWHSHLLRWKYGETTGEVDYWVDGNLCLSHDSISMDTGKVTSNDAGINIASIDAGNNITFEFDQFVFSETNPDPGFSGSLALGKMSNKRGNKQ